MKKSSADLTRIAERAAHRAQRPATAGTNPAMRDATPVQQTHGHVGRRGKRPASDKGQGLWRTQSPDFFTDPAWSRTVSDWRC